MGLIRLPTLLWRRDSPSVEDTGGLEECISDSEDHEPGGAVRLRVNGPAALELGWARIGIL